jgi:hypothetical protein
MAVTEVVAQLLYADEENSSGKLNFTSNSLNIS